MLNDVIVRVGSDEGIIPEGNQGFYVLDVCEVKTVLANRTSSLEVAPALKRWKA